MTIRANARLALSEQERVRSHRKEAVVAALYGELVVIKDGLEANLKGLDEQQTPSDLLHPLRTRPHPVLDACFAQLGLLSKPAVQRVVRAYAVWEEMPNKMMLAFGSQARIRDDHIFVSAQQNQLYRSILQAALEPISEALGALDEESAAEQN